jgi:large subunit ribosomal protein L10
VESFDSLLEGPSAIAFIKGDPVVAAKGLRDFAKANPLLVIKGGVLDGKALDSDEINRLADLESREVLLSKLAGAMKAAPQQAVSLFAAPLAQAARLFAALQDKLPAQDAPVADEAPAAEAVQDAPAEAPAEASTEETASADS